MPETAETPNRKPERQIGREAQETAARNMEKRKKEKRRDGRRKAEFELKSFICLPIY